MYNNSAFLFQIIKYNAILINIRFYDFIFIGGETMEEKYCQCCSMPMGDTDDLYGTNDDRCFSSFKTLEERLDNTYCYYFR